MLFLIWIILIIFGFLPFKSHDFESEKRPFLNINTIYSMVVIAFFVVVAFLGTKAPDYEIYRSAFLGENASSHFIETGSGFLYDWINRVCGTYLHMNFQFFKAFLTGWTFFVYFLFCHYFTKHTRYFFTLLLMYPGLLQIVQFRFAFASSFFLLAMLFHIKGGYKRNYFFFLLFLIIACQLHSSFYFFGIIVFVDFIRKYGHLIWHYKIPIIIVMAAALVVLKAPLIKVMGMVVGALRAQRYLQNVETGLGGLIMYVFSFIVNYFLSYGLLRKFKGKEQVSKKQFSLIEHENYLRLLTFISIVLVMQTPDFLRISRSIYFLSFVVMALFVEKDYKYIYIPVFNKYGFDLNMRIFYPLYIFVTGFIYIFCFTPEVVSSLLF